MTSSATPGWLAWAAKKLLECDAMILVIDNYDSFTYNLVQYLGELGASVEVYRNDRISVDEIALRKPAGLLISPGPGNPDQAGITLQVLRRYAGKLPILGVCLGHQAIGQVFGGRVVRAARLMHGRTSSIHHSGRGVFAGLPTPFTATRYHSLIVERESLGSELEITAWTDQGEIMGLSHRSLQVQGVQFHPESFLTEHGHAMLRNFLAQTGLTLPDRNVAGGSMKDAIAAAVGGVEVEPAAMEAAISSILRGEASPVQTAALLIALRSKGETAQEIATAAAVMRRHCVPVALTPKTVLLDTCGTGGDGGGTFNISTAAGLVIAACDIPLAKHGNRAASSKTGSADVLEVLGVNIELPAAQVARCIETVGIGFMFARTHHPAMKHVGPIRAELGVRTLFNFLGPLCNPAAATHQVLGVPEPRLLGILSHALNALGGKRAWVVHGHGGLDELALTGPTRVAQLDGGAITEFQVTPEDFGLSTQPNADLRVADAQASAEVIRSVLRGDKGAARDVVVLNAAAGLCVAGRAPSFVQAARLAADAIDSGAALSKLSAWVAATAAD